MYLVGFVFARVMCVTCGCKRCKRHGLGLPVGPVPGLRRLFSALGDPVTLNTPQGVFIIDRPSTGKIILVSAPPFIKMADKVDSPTELALGLN